MAINISRITELFHKNILGNLSDSEREELNKILQNEDLAELDKRLQDSKYVVDRLVDYNRYDHHKAFRKFKAATSRKTFTHRLPAIASVAAAIAIIISIFIIQHQHNSINRTTEETLLQAQQILPGNKKAIIRLANGETINMSDSALKMDIAGIGEVNYIDGQISYKTSKNTLEKFNELIVPRGGECMITLYDGTKVWLNSGSTLKYPTKFSGKERRVILTGGAFFDVTHDPEHPFIVTSPKMTLTVKGPSFNLKDYATVNLRIIW